MLLRTQNPGLIAISKAIASQPMHIAIGTGDGAWNDPPLAGTNETAMRNEIGRRQVNDVRFVTPATQAAHELQVGTNYYNYSVNPTRYLSVQCRLQPSDVAGVTIREFALFIGTVANSGVPAGAQWLIPAQLANAGDLYQLGNSAPIPANSTVLPSPVFVLPF